MSVFFHFLLFIMLNSQSVLATEADNLLIAKQQISLENRYDNKFVNDVFKDNILLNIAYMREDVRNASDINWDAVRKPFDYRFTLKPHEAFAFHEDVLPEFRGNVVKTSNAHFNLREGFRSDGYLPGDGVCHLASLMFWAAKDAGLETYAPTNHDFRRIPEIEPEYGVSIYKTPYTSTSSALQNLYITNNTEAPVTFTFEYDGQNLTVSVSTSLRESSYKI